MESDLDKISRAYNSNDLSKLVEGMELSVKTIGEITDLSLRILEEKRYDMFVVTEKISTFFDDYLRKLFRMINSADDDLRFWSASLISHYNINNQQAEAILLNEVKSGTTERSQIATTILARNKNPFLIEVIEARLKREVGEKRDQSFFEEKLQLLKSFQR